MSFRATRYGSATRDPSPFRTYVPSLRHSHDAAAAQTYTEQARIEFTIVSSSEIRVDSVYCLDREVVTEGRKEWEWASMPGLLAQVKRQTAINEYQGLHRYFNTDGRDIYGKRNLSNGSKHRVEGSITVRTVCSPTPVLHLQVVVARRAPPLSSPSSSATSRSYTKPVSSQSPTSCAWVRRRAPGQQPFGQQPLLNCILGNLYVKCTVR